jgi:pilus assembly protein CpaE
MTKKPLPALILLLQEDAADAATVRQALAQKKDGLLRMQCVDRLPTALARLAGGGVDLILLDLALGEALPGDRLDTFLKLQQLVPHTPIVVLSRPDEEGVALRAMRAGAADFLPKQQWGDSLGQVLRSVMERSHNPREPDSRGVGATPKNERIIAVLGAKGGVGTTTVALNVASDLARRHQVILVEMRPLFGTLSLFFKPHGTIRNLSHLPPTLAAEQVRACLWRYDGLPGLNVLFGPQTPSECQEIAPGRARAILKTLAAMADYVVVDLPASLSDANREVVENASCLALIAEQDPICIETAGRVERAIQSWSGAPQSMGTVIVNRAMGPPQTELDQINAGIEKPLGIIPAEPDLCLRAQTAHMPLVAFLPKSLLAESLAALAAKVEPAVRVAA